MLARACLLAKQFHTHIVCILASGFGSGLAPIAPGTCGTLVAVLMHYLLMSYSPHLLLVSLVLATGAGVYICDQRTKTLGIEDHPSIVWDEIVGYGITTLWLPFEWQWLLASFVVFRALDIFKPWPISIVDQQVKGGVGIMADDVLCGVIGCALLHLVHYGLSAAKIV